jgi:hypothetical protein
MVMVIPFAWANWLVLQYQAMMLHQGRLGRSLAFIFPALITIVVVVWRLSMVV